MAGTGQEPRVIYPSEGLGERERYNFRVLLSGRAVRGHPDPLSRTGAALRAAVEFGRGITCRHAKSWCGCKGFSRLAP